MNASVSSQPLAEMVAEHLSEAAFLWQQRAHAVHAPHVDPRQFDHLDEQLAAHLDGLTLAGALAWDLLEAELPHGGPEHFFCAASYALAVDPPRWALVLRHLGTRAECAPGIASALAWSSGEVFGRATPALLESEQALHRKIALAAYGMRRVDPGAKLSGLLASGPDSVRIRAARTAGELARNDLLPRLLEVAASPRPELAFWALRSAVLLGDRGDSVTGLCHVALVPGPRQADALRLALQALPPSEAHRLLVALEGQRGAERFRIIGAGVSGGCRYLPWLLSEMDNTAHTRIAAEAFVNITGVDFNLEQLQSLPPEGFEDGPTDDPDDDVVELPEDIALPWPDKTRLGTWWQAHEKEFPPDRVLLLGRERNLQTCELVLKTGFQRQRVDAARLSAVLSPGRVLFPTSAPAWRQRRLSG